MNPLEGPELFLRPDDGCKQVRHIYLGNLIPVVFPGIPYVERESGSRMTDA